MTFPHSVLSWALVFSFLGLVLVDHIVAAFLSFMEDTMLQSWSSGSGLLPHLRQCSLSLRWKGWAAAVSVGADTMWSVVLSSLTGCSFLSQSPAAPPGSGEASHSGGGPLVCRWHRGLAFFFWCTPL